MTEWLVNRDYFEVCCRNWPLCRTFLKRTFFLFVVKMEKIVQFPHNHLILFHCYGDGMAQEGNHRHVIHNKKKKKEKEKNIRCSSGKAVHSSSFY
jgi:hypothetical protein